MNAIPTNIIKTRTIKNHSIVLKHCSVEPLLSNALEIVIDGLNIRSLNIILKNKCNIKSIKYLIVIIILKILQE
jgi:hypothetical protein